MAKRQPGNSIAVRGFAPWALCRAAGAIERDSAMDAAARHRSAGLRGYAAGALAVLALAVWIVAGSGPAVLESARPQPGYNEEQAVSAWWEHAYAEPSGGNAGSPPSALLPQPERAVIAGLSRFESGPQPAYITDALAQLDARDHPGITVTMESIVLAAATGRVREMGGSLSDSEMDALLEATGWPVEWREEAQAIAWCESRWRPGAVGDGGNSLGMWQMWTGWFPEAGYSVEQAYDPEVNSRVALYVRQTRGRWGGGGGWSCADLLGLN